LLLFRLIIVRVLFFKLIFSKGVVIVRLQLLAYCVHVDVYGIDSLRCATRLVVDLLNLSV
jgi:hypothetical protein